MSKEYKISIDVTERVINYCEAIVPADSLEDAIKIFEKDPHSFEWEGWTTVDGEVLNWEIDEDNCEMVHCPDDCEP
jgi:hypothetical protein